MEDNTLVEIIYVYLGRSESLKKAQKLYRDKNPEKMKEIRKRHYEKVKNDVDFKEKQSKQKKSYYERKKNNACPVLSPSSDTPPAP